MPLHSLTNFEIQKYYQNEPRNNSVYSRNNLRKIKERAYIINPNEHKLIGSHWTILYVSGDNVTYFDSFEVGHISIEIKKFISNRNITTNISGIQRYDSKLCGYFCIGFIDFMLKCKSLLEYTNLFSLNLYEINDKIILKYFQEILKRLR